MNAALKSAFALAAAAQFGFAAKAIFIKLAYRAQPSLDALTLLTWRMLASLPFFLLLAWWAKRHAQGESASAISRNDWGRIAVLGFVGYYLASYLDFLGLQYISAALERLILFVNPTIVALISWAFLGLNITRTHALALVLTYAGIVLAYWHDLRITQDQRALMLGSTLVLASAIAYAVYLVTSAGLTRRIGSARFTAYMMCVSTAFVLAHFLAARPITALAVAPQTWIHIGCLAIFSTVLPVWAIAEALKRIGANQTAMLGTIGPIFTIGLGVVFLNETVSGLQLLGAALTILGVTLMTRKKSAPQR